MHPYYSEALAGGIWTWNCTFASKNKNVTVLSNWIIYRDGNDVAIYYGYDTSILAFNASVKRMLAMVTDTYRHRS